MVSENLLTNFQPEELIPYHALVLSRVYTSKRLREPAMSDHLVNWEKIWNSFAWSADEDPEEVIQQRLRQRAEQYAAPVQRVEIEPEAVRTVLNFHLGDEYYGVDVMTVRGVRTINRITRVPGIPHFYRGVVNVRGQVITVLDLRLFFDVPAEDAAKAPDELVVVRASGLEIGLLAHNIEGVQAVPIAAVEPVENMRYAWGVTRHQLVLLDVERLLEDEQLVVGGADDN